MSTEAKKQALQIAVLTISDTRTMETDTSGQLLSDLLMADGHQVADRQIVKDDIYQIRAVVSNWIANDNVQVILTTGGTGFSGRDSTPEALAPLFDKQIDGFGELFRYVSLEQVGTSTIQSRALAGFANGVVIFALPGSRNAVKTAWQSILSEQLDSRFKPCNFVSHVKVVDDE